MTTQTESPSHADRQQFVQSLLERASTHRAVHHPWLAEIAAGGFADMRSVLAHFAREYHGYTSRFTDYLKVVISKLENETHRELLSRNLEEEQGELHDEDLVALREIGIDPETINGVPHKDLFKRFAHAIGLSDDELQHRGPNSLRWSDEFMDYLQQAPAAAAVGALGLGTENIVKPVYNQLLRGVKELGLSQDEHVFFDLHCTVDDQHALDLNIVAIESIQDAESRRQLRDGMLTSLRLRERFWDQLHRECLLISRPASKAAVLSHAN